MDDLRNWGWNERKIIVVNFD